MPTPAARQAVALPSLLDSVKPRVARLLAGSVRTRTLRPIRPVPLVSFTFDDVDETGATAGATVLEAHGVRGTFYVSGSLLGAAHPDRRFATLDRCVGLHRRGHEIGCHTFSHRPVAGYAAADLEADLARNQACLAAQDPTIRFVNFAYPYNATSLRAKRLLQARFASCRGGLPGVNAGTLDLGFLRAVELGDARIDEKWVRAWADEAVRCNGWLIFFTHGVTRTAEPWSCAPGLLDAAVRGAKAAGCEPVTIAGALARLGALSPVDTRP